MIFYDEYYHRNNKMHSIISENNQATQDIFGSHILPYFLFKIFITHFSTLNFHDKFNHREI